jgi:hypothetical protein
MAVASSHGFCTLDDSSSGGDDGCVHTMSSPYKASKQFGSHLAGRWRRFGKTGEEEDFTVVAFAWWEAQALKHSSGNLGQEDLIVAVIEVHRGEAGRYLSCWSPTMLDLDHQLTFPTSGTRKCRWGIPLPEGFHPSKVDLLVQPDLKHINGERKAILLLSDDSLSTTFCIYQFQLVGEPLISNDPYRDSLKYFVLAQCVTVNDIGSPADLFIASAFFGFNLRIHSNHDPLYIATLGVLRFPGTGMDALSVNRHNVVAVGPVLATMPETDITSIWKADFIQGKQLTKATGKLNIIVWILELTDGSFFAWFVPCAFTSSDSEKLLEALDSETKKSTSRFIHPECLVLGYAAPTGRSSLWLHRSAAQPSRSFLLNMTPTSVYGCILGSGQGLQKFHRSLGEHFEQEQFRSDFLEHETLGPCDFVLSFPAFLPSYYSQLLDGLSNLEHVFRQLETRIRSSVYYDISFKSLQLLISRLVEEIGALTVPSTTQRTTSSIFAAMVEFARAYTTPLQFAAVMLEIGRQLEPCYFDSLFPLPKAPNNLGLEGDETVLDLYDLSLDYGSILASASSLPLQKDSETLKRNCQLILNHCLDAIDVYFDLYGNTGFDVVSEEQLVLCDVFRYTFKLEDAHEESSEEDYSSDDTSTYSRNGDARLSIFCGIWGRSKPSGLEMKVDNDIKYTCTNKNEAPVETGARMVGRYLIKFALVQEHWKKAAALAMLVVGESTLGLNT